MRKIVLVSLDAMCDRDWARYNGRWMGNWLEQAAVCTQVKTVFPALTYPAHTTMITGCDPIRHGIGHNQPFQPGVPPEMRRWYWRDQEIRRETIFQAVKRNGGRCASILWPVTGKSKAIRWNFPEIIALPGENQVTKILSYGSTLWLIHMLLKYRKERASIEEPFRSDYAVHLACDVIRSHQPDLTAIHLVDVDEMRHQYGVNSPEAQAGMDRMEQRVQRIWETMQQTPGMEDALLVLVSDHGQADVDRLVDLEEELMSAGLSVEVQASGMTAYLYTDAVEETRAWLEEHGGSIGVSHVYTDDELDRAGCIWEPDLAVEAAPGVIFDDGMPHTKKEKATHGFGMGHPAENCLMAVRGKDVRACRMPAMPMRDVGPTLAGLMGIDLPDAVGEDHSKSMKME